MPVVADRLRQLMSPMLPERAALDQVLKACIATQSKGQHQRGVTARKMGNKE
jgi:hypothetical protein